MVHISIFCLHQIITIRINWQGWSHRYQDQSGDSQERDTRSVDNVDSHFHGNDALRQAQGADGF